MLLEPGATTDALTANQITITNVGTRQGSCLVEYLSTEISNAYTIAAGAARTIATMKNPVTVENTGSTQLQVA